jgi:methionyl-tRNA formyltransferase
MNNTLIAIGRSKLLYDSIIYLKNKGYIFKAIITDKAYGEYDIKEDDFEKLAGDISAQFHLTNNLSSQNIKQLIINENIDLAISANWKYIFESSYLNLFKNGILNLHLGNLPDYKGNATANWAILNGEKFIYANVHKVEIDLDTGDILSRAKIEISENTYIADILADTCKVAPLLFEEAIAKIRENPEYFIEAGSKKGMRCYPRLPEYNQINWFDSGENIFRLIRASSRPYSGAFTFLDNKKIIIWRANIVRPENSFLAVPGHIVEIDKESGSIFVACKDVFLKITEIEVENDILKPASFLKSIRLRFRS